MSNKVYVIADLHFGHTNVALRRGFYSVEEHDQHIIETWNETVNKYDTVYILGDISMEKKRYYTWLDQLKGYKKVILGNHDVPRHVPELLKYVNFVCSSFLYKERLLLTHIPIHPSEMYRYEKNIHGHLHDKEIDDPRYICVSCEVVNYTPKLLTELL